MQLQFAIAMMATHLCMIFPKILVFSHLLYVSFSCKKKDLKRLEKSEYKASDHYKSLRRKARAKRKGFDDKAYEDEGTMYQAGGFDSDPVPQP